MRKIATTLILLVMAVVAVQAQNMRAYLSYATFDTPDDKPYIETYLTIKNSSLKQLVQQSGQYSGKLNVQIIFRQNDSTIVNYGKYELNGPEIVDTMDNALTFLDVQRYSLVAGVYDLELMLDDLNDGKEPVVSHTTFEIGFPEDSISISDIEFLKSYEKKEGSGILDKNGYEIVPYVFNSFPEEEKELKFYAEIYHADKEVGEGAYIVYEYIRPFEVNKKLDKYFYMKRMNSGPVNVLMNTIDISNLATGNYLLVIEAHNRKNELIASKELFFYRDNPLVGFNETNVMTADISNTFVEDIKYRDSLLLYIDYLYPISTSSEKIYVKSMIKTADVQTLQKYFYNFWVDRDNVDPEGAWFTYLQRVKEANANFKTVSVAGYRSDRGRVYLQYGKPNVVAESHNEPAAYPYEIWHYYQIGGQHDIKFVFYTRDLVTNDFQLIHSNMVGELSNYRWQNQLYGRTWDSYSIDDMIVPNSYGSFATDYYKQPR